MLLFLHEDLWFLWKRLFFFFFLPCSNAGEKFICRLLLTYLRRAGSAERWECGGLGGGKLDKPTIYAVNLGLQEEEVTHHPSLQMLMPWQQGKCGAIQQKNTNKIMCVSLTCCSYQKGQRVHSSSPVPINLICPFSRLLPPARNPVWSGPELEDNQLEHSCGSPTLIKQTGAVVLCRAGYLPACLQEDLTLSPPMEAPSLLHWLLSAFLRARAGVPKVDNRPFFTTQLIILTRLERAKARERI